MIANAKKQQGTKAAVPVARRRNSSTTAIKNGILARKHSKAKASNSRLNLLVRVRVLLQYLARVDPHALAMAAAVLKDCELKHAANESKYDTLADAINERVRDAVGEAHWSAAARVQRRLASNLKRQRTKRNALQRDARR